MKANLPPVAKIAITGGPCAGKTTSLARLRDELASKGIRVFMVPEAATMIFSAGVTIDDIKGDDECIHFQSTLLQTQIHLENSLKALAERCGSPAVLLCDRGAMDGRAYMTPEMWKRLLAHNKLDECMLRDERYDLVVHLITAADGAEKHYSLENNHTRTETIPEAIALDKKTRESWVGHKNLCLFDNSTDFEGKIKRVISCVLDNITAHTAVATSPKNKKRKATETDEMPLDAKLEREESVSVRGGVGSPKKFCVVDVRQEQESHQEA